MIGLDTSFLIDYMTGVNGAVNTFNKLNYKKIYVTQITVFEFYFGIFNSKKGEIIKEQRLIKFDSLIDSVNVLDLNTNSSKKAAKIASNLKNSGKIIDNMDILISAILLSNNINRILTRNKKDFSKIEELEVISY